MAPTSTAAAALLGDPQGVWLTALIIVLAACSAACGFWRGSAVPRRRQARGLPRADPARVRFHDAFNLALLPLLVLADVAVLADAFDASLFTMLFLVYCVADLIWIWLRPEAVPQPSLVLTHHVGVLALLSHPLRWPEHARFTAFVAIVEVNTIILVGRRYFAAWLLQPSPRTRSGSVSRVVVRQSLSALYWSSFFGIRFGVHPYMVWVSLNMRGVPILERCLLVGLLSLLVIFSLVLLGKQLLGVWDDRAKEPLPQFELFLHPGSPHKSAEPAPAGVLEFPWGWRKKKLSEAPQPEPEVTVHPAAEPSDASEDEGCFCGLDELLSSAVEAGALPEAAAAPADGADERRIELLDAGFCNRVHRVTAGEGAVESVDVVAKQFSTLSRARSTAAAVATDRLSSAQGGGSPPLLFASAQGVVHEYCQDGAVLSEACVGPQGSRATVRAAARAVAKLHCTPLHLLPAEAAASPPMVWVSVDTMLGRLDRHAEGGRLPPAPPSRSWSVAQVRRVCERERALLASQRHQIVVGHGDLKPTNVLGITASDNPTEAVSRAVLIDFELGGPNYRGFDLCKLFRNDAGAIDTTPDGPLRSFLREYRAACVSEQAAAGGEWAELPDEAGLAAEAAALEPMSWLEAAVFFMTVLGMPPDCTDWPQSCAFACADSRGDDVVESSGRVWQERMGSARSSGRWRRGCPPTAGSGTSGCARSANLLPIDVLDGFSQEGSCVCIIVLSPRPNEAYPYKRTPACPQKHPPLSQPHDQGSKPQEGWRTCG